MNEKAKIRIGALISGGGSNLQAIISACAAEKIDGEIVFVGTDVPAAKGLDKAKNFNIPTFAVDYTNIIRRYKSDPDRFSLPDDADMDRLAALQSLLPPGTDPEKIRAFLAPRIIAEARLLEAMAPRPFDLLVLAGFMRILTPYIIDRVNTVPGKPRIMNIHPALLPAFPGVDGYGDTYRHGCKVAGCTVHFIDYGEDTGPIIGQRSFPIDPVDTIETVRKKGLQLEWQLYPECIQLYARNRLVPTEQKYSLPTGASAKRLVVKINRD